MLSRAKNEDREPRGNRLIVGINAELKYSSVNAMCCRGLYSAPGALDYHSRSVGHNQICIVQKGVTRYYEIRPYCYCGNVFNKHVVYLSARQLLASILSNIDNLTTCGSE